MAQESDKERIRELEKEIVERGKCIEEIKVIIDAGLGSLDSIFLKAKVRAAHDRLDEIITDYVDRNGDYKYRVKMERGEKE